MSFCWIPILWWVATSQWNTRYHDWPFCGNLSLQCLLATLCIVINSVRWLLFYEGNKVSSELTLLNWHCWIPWGVSSNVSSLDTEDTLGHVSTKKSVTTMCILLATRHYMSSQQNEYVPFCPMLSSNSSLSQNIARTKWHLILTNIVTFMG